MPPALAFLLILLTTAALTYTLFVLAYAKTLISPPRMTDGKAILRLGRMTPRDLNLPYEELTLPAHHTTTPAWWIPFPTSTKTAILLHAFGDAKVGALAWAPLFRSLGFNLLLLDLRAHGESKTKTHTAGRLETQDLALAIQHIQERYPTAAQDILLFGASFGAAIAANYAAQDPDESVNAIVLDSPVTSFERGAIAHANLFALPGPLVGRAAVRLASLWTGTNFTDTATLTQLPKIKLPTLLILPQQDAYLSPADRSAFQNATAALPNGKLWQPDTTHLLAINTDPHRYQEELTALLPTSDTIMRH